MKSLASLSLTLVRRPVGWPLRLYYRHQGERAPRRALTCRQGATGDYALTSERFRSDN